MQGTVMSTFSLQPTYFQITWNQDTPVDYTNLTGIAAGGLDSTSAANYNRIIFITGVNDLSSNPMADGDSIIINGYRIYFDSGDDLNSIIGKINLARKFTNIIADNRVSTNYLTLANAPGYEGAAFYIANGVAGSLDKLGLSAGQYGYYPSLIGSNYTTVNGGNVTINGINIVFAAGNLASIVTQLNANTPATSVQAYAAGPKLQLASTTGQPFSINGGNVVSNLGISTGNFGGYPDTLLNSQNKERANMRWQQVINELESFGTPNFVGNIVVSGDKTGNSPVTTFSFVVGYEQPAYIQTTARDPEPDAGTQLFGVDALKRSVARAMLSTISSNRKVFDPTLLSYSAYTDRPNAQRIQNIVAGPIDIQSNLIVQVETNITVNQITSV